MNIINMREGELAIQNTVEFKAIAEAVSRWFVRRDSKFFSVDNLTVKLSQREVVQASLYRVGPELGIKLTDPKLMRAVIKRVIEDQHDDQTQSIPVWNGRVACRPYVKDRFIWENGMVAINSWNEPAFRRIGEVEPDFGAAEGFLRYVFPRKAEREMVVNWLAWNLQNEANKPGWAPFFYSDTKGSGKSTFCWMVAKLFGEENSVTQNNVDKLAGRFNMTLLQSKLGLCQKKPA